MSTWRRLALEQFPELKKAHVPLETLVDLYSELSRFLRGALKAGNETMVQRVIAYALWGARQAKDESFIHNTYDLFAQVIHSPPLREALWRQLTPNQFNDLKTYFYNPCGIAAQPNLKDLEQEYRFTPRPNRAKMDAR